MLLDKVIRSVSDLPKALQDALQHGVSSGLCAAGKEVVVLSSTNVTKKTTSERGSGQTLHYHMHTGTHLTQSVLANVAQPMLASKLV